MASFATHILRGVGSDLVASSTQIGYRVGTGGTMGLLGRQPIFSAGITFYVSDCLEPDTWLPLDDTTFVLGRDAYNEMAQMITLLDDPPFDA